ncbi:MAG: cryptochrome/photolyase family protein, partial [Labilithrix sp.]|nr:cryptochrome/photolyase family protein [Labilithrix sp.]
NVRGMSTFRRALDRRRVARASRRWLFVAYDQLSDEIGPLSREDPRTLGIVLVECPEKAARRPYHKQKLALVVANLRHFALEQAARGVEVRHLVAPSYAAAIEEVVKETGALRVMRPAERELRRELAPLVARGALEEIPHEGWLTETADFDESQRGLPWRMDAFYRHVRRRLGVLMEGEKPLGGRFSFDPENRRRWPGTPDAPAPPTFTPDAITREVCDLVNERMARHPGALRPEALPATKGDAERVWRWAKARCLPEFGPFEDAMSTASRGLFHTRVSPLLNLLRLPARRVVAEVAAMDELPLQSREGFVRQVLGWREYVRHVHEATDGFRVIDGERQASARTPGDGGFRTWAGERWKRGAGGDGGSRVSALGASAPLPPAYWGAPSGLRCLDDVVTAVWEEGYSHHITRLMVLSNVASLLDVSPRELTDWFWVAYVDAYDWVVEPNVLGMGTFGAGALMTTKPYVAGSAYIDRMSDFCEGCRFDPKTTCPFPALYWAYLGRHRDALADVQRMKLPLVAESKRSAAQRRADAAVFERTRRTLARGEPLSPDDGPPVRERRGSRRTSARGGTRTRSRTSRRSAS